jgi:hypothetical protein
MKNEFKGMYVVATVTTNERKMGTHGRKVVGAILRAGPAGIKVDDLKPDPNGNLNKHIAWELARGRVKVLARAPRAARQG